MIYKRYVYERNYYVAQSSLKEFLYIQNALCIKYEGFLNAVNASYSDPLSDQGSTQLQGQPAGSVAFQAYQDFGAYQVSVFPHNYHKKCIFITAYSVTNPVRVYINMCIEYIKLPTA